MGSIVSGAGSVSSSGISKDSAAIVPDIKRVAAIMAMEAFIITSLASALAGFHRSAFWSSQLILVLLSKCRGAIVEPSTDLKGGNMNISAPRQITLIISVVIALLALIAAYSGVAIPVIGESPLATLLIAYLVLLVGNLFEGI